MMRERPGATMRIVTRHEGADETRSIVTREAKVVFTWVEDRWAHAVLFGRMGESPRPLLYSHDELASNDARVINLPVYQQVHLQEQPDCCTALLVGQSGHEHYSSSIRVTEESNGTTRIEVDIANRHTRPPLEPRPLAANYLVDLLPSTIEEATHTFVRWVSELPRGHVCLASVDSAPTNTVLIVSDAGKACFAQPIAQYVPAQSAQRCRFVWTWEPSLARGQRGATAV